MEKNPFLDLATNSVTHEEKEFATSFYLKESVAASLATLCERMGVTKKKLVNDILDVGLEQFIDAIYETRPDLMVDDGPTEPNEDGRIWTILKPSHIREVKSKIGGSIDRATIKEILEAR